MKPESKDKLKEALTEVGWQLGAALVFGVLGAVGVAYILLGWGVLWMLMPFGALIYFSVRKGVLKNWLNK